MDDAWFTGLADELARCLVDARTAADAAEAVLEAARELEDPELRRRAARALIAPAAVARVLMDLIDQPPQLVLAATRLLRDAAGTAADDMESFPALDTRQLVAALRTAAASCERLLEAT